METFFLPMEDGTEQEFALLETFPFEGRTYLLAAAVQGDALAEETCLYRCEQDGDELIVNNIDDDEEYDRVAAAWAAREDA